MSQINQLGMAIRNALTFAEEMRKRYPEWDEQDLDWQVCWASLGTSLEACRAVAEHINKGTPVTKGLQGLEGAERGG